MKKGIKMVLVAVMACILCAAGVAESLSVKIDVTVSVKGTAPVPAETYKIELTADDASFPMPGGAKGQTAQIAIVGAGSKSFESIEFKELGDYSYTLKQLKGSNANCVKYDDSVYHIKVHVTSDKDGVFEKSVVMYVNDEDEKVAKAAFENTYRVQPSPTPPSHQPVTGVRDIWPYYLAGAVLLLGIASVMLFLLRRRENDEK